MSFASNVGSIKSIVNDIKNKINIEKNNIRPLWEGQAADAFFNYIV